MKKIDIDQKTPGQLVDELITVSMKLFANQDILAVSKDESKIVRVTKESLVLNSKRNQLIAAINSSLDISSSYERKTYE